MDNDVTAAALTSLAGVRHSRRDAAPVAPRASGLYAVWGDGTAWGDLNLVPDFADQPLYIGKAERDLNARDVRTHFATGSTGRSTLRRSLAALLVDDLRMVAVPRNAERPDESATFALDVDSDDRLSQWMDNRLSLSTWTKPPGVVLDEIETEVIRRLHPPLNLNKVAEPRPRLRAARRRMADAARAWQAEPDPNSSGWAFKPPAALKLSGQEPFDGLQASVLEFWRFAMSDLRTNNVRGYLAEFLVARAVGSTQRRVEWDAWDVTAPDGTRIEVKSAGYLQAWAQKELSTPTFRVAATHSWDVETLAYSAEPGYHADLYVFCVHTAKRHIDYDPLSMSQWEFYVADRAAVAAQSGRSMGLGTLTGLVGEPVSYSGLGDAVSAAVATRQVLD